MTKNSYTIVSRAFFLETESTRHRPRFCRSSSRVRKTHETSSSSSRSSAGARPPSRPFTHARASTTLDGTSHLTVNRRGSRRHPRVPPRRLAIHASRGSRRLRDARCRARDPNAPDAIARREGRGATRLERRRAVGRARATRRIRGMTRDRPASSFAAAEPRGARLSGPARVARRLGFCHQQTLSSGIGFSSILARREREPPSCRSDSARVIITRASVSSLRDRTRTPTLRASSRIRR